MSTEKTPRLNKGGGDPKYGLTSPAKRSEARMPPRGTKSGLGYVSPYGVSLSVEVPHGKSQRLIEVPLSEGDLLWLIAAASSALLQLHGEK